MICPSCGHENPENSKFCNNCGARLETEGERASSGEVKGSDIELGVMVDSSNHEGPSTSNTAANDLTRPDSAEAVKGSSDQQIVTDSESELAASASEQNAATAAEDCPVVNSDPVNSSAEQLFAPELSDSATTPEEAPETEAQGEVSQISAEPTSSDAVQFQENVVEKQAPSESSANSAKRPLQWKLIVVIALAILVPPAGIVLAWLWKIPAKKIVRTVATIVVAAYCALWVVGIAGGVSAAVESSRLESLVEADTNLDGTYVTEGLVVHYPSTWVKSDGESSAYASETGIVFDVSHVEAKADGIDLSKFNLEYRRQFELMAQEAASALKNSGYTFDMQGAQLNVRDNVMTYRIAYTSNIDGEARNGIMLVFYDGSGNDGLFDIACKKDGEFANQNRSTIENVVSSLEFTGKKFDKDPENDPVIALDVSYDGKTDEGVVLDGKNTGYKDQGDFRGRGVA